MTILPQKFTLVFNGIKINFRSDNGWVCLTDLWKAGHSPTNKEPSQWFRLPQSLELIEVLKQNMGLSHIYETRRGKGGGTFATRELALEYASYLSVEIRAWLLQAGLERIEEEANPDLAYTRGRDRAMTGWSKQGLDVEQMYARMDAIEEQLRETREEIEDRRLPGDDLYLPDGVN